MSCDTPQAGDSVSETDSSVATASWKWHYINYSSYADFLTDIISEHGNLKGKYCDLKDIVEALNCGAEDCLNHQKAESGKVQTVVDHLYEQKMDRVSLLSGFRESEENPRTSEEKERYCYLSGEVEGLNRAMFYLDNEFYLCGDIGGSHDKGST